MSRQTRAEDDTFSIGYCSRPQMTALSVSEAQVALIVSKRLPDDIQSDLSRRREFVYISCFYL